MSIRETLRLKLAIPNAERIFYIAQAFQKGASIDEVYELTKIDRWFLRNIAEVVAEARMLEDRRHSCARRNSVFPIDNWPSREAIGKRNSIQEKS